MKKHFDTKGFGHHFLLPILAVIAVGSIGLLTLKLSNAATGPGRTNFTVATYNIRATRLSKSAWDDNRANAILGYIKTVDVIGLQETQRETVNHGTKHKAVSVANRSENWLTNKLATVGYSRSTPTVSPRYGDKNYDNGEDRVIFWNNHKFTLVKQGQSSVADDTIKNDEIVSEGNESLSKHRNLVWVKLREITTGKVFYFMTTHLTWGGSTVSYKAVRGEQITQILDYVNTHMTDAPVIFVGDMNSRSGSKEDKMIRGGGFSDSYRIAATKQNTKYSTAIANFKGGLTGDVNTNAGHHIDHIYVKNGVVVNRIEIVDQKGSDHLPVEADVSL